jgi:acetyl esterase/lipase
VGNNFQAQKMDIYIPPGLTAPAPVIVYIHGGGWIDGSKGSGNVQYFSTEYNAGFICVDINYRLSGDTTWPAQIEDCKTAVRFLKVNASIYNIDTCRFGVMGFSSGGHLATMLGTSADVSSLEGLHQGSIQASSRVQAVLDIFGPTDFLFMDGYYPASCGTNGYLHEYNSNETRLLNIDSLHNHPATVEAANPVSYVSPDDAHFFIMHGTADCYAPIYQSTLLDSALLANGIPADTFIKLPGQGHGGTIFNNALYSSLYKDFFLQHLSTPCNTTGLVDPNPRFVSFFPNPATDEIQINYVGKDEFQIQIINMLGQTVKKTYNQWSVDISDLTSGPYFILWISDSDRVTKPFVKK